MGTVYILPYFSLFFFSIEQLDREKDGRAIVKRSSK